jgi:hypothetical protein
VAWSFSGPAVWSVLLVVMAGAVARYATVAASRQARVVVDDDKVSSNEDEPLQKLLQ